MKKKYIIYLLSALLPVLIFLTCTIINGFVPFGKELLNSFDAFEQYSGMLLEYSRLLKEGNIFYSWGAGLGFNFLGSLFYYGMSPLNLLAIFATPKNFHMFFAIMTFLRFSLLGLSMAFYLDSKKTKPTTTVLFSVVYSLMGFTSTYFYNYIWIDSIIILPLVIYSLDKLIDENKCVLYTIILAITIMINFYIGYMICIFSCLWFFYRLINKKSKKKLIKNFTIYSLFAGLLSSIVLLPCFFALLTGKAELYNTIDLKGLSNNFGTLIYMMSNGAYIRGAHINGQALVYSSILSLVLVVFYFFNTKFSKNEKISTAVILIIFYLSFSINFLNYAWHMFQKPIWWPNRFAFLFSFFIIVISAKTLDNIDKTKLSMTKRIIIGVILSILIITGDVLKRGSIKEAFLMTSFSVFLSLILLFTYLLLLDRKKIFIIVALFTVLDLFMNSFNVLYNLRRDVLYTDKMDLKMKFSNIKETLDRENNGLFYRSEMTHEYTSDDGLYFGYNGINYFNSVRNMNVIRLFKSLGVTVKDDCHVTIEKFDPVIYSILNVKYLYGDNREYFIKKSDLVNENPYPLSIGFIGNASVKNLKFKKDPFYNKEMLIKSLSNLDEDLYKKYSSDDFDLIKDEKSKTYTKTFTSDKRYQLIPAFDSIVTIDNKKYEDIENHIIEPGRVVSVTFNTDLSVPKEEIFFHLLDIDSYIKHMKILSQNTLQAYTNKNGHILEGTIDVTEDSGYLFTSIEYEKGMNIYIDGKKQEPDIIVDALIGLPLEKGKHHITIDYVPKELILGTIISSISLFIFIIFNVIVNKNLKHNI